MSNHRRDYARIPKGGSFGHKVDRETFYESIRLYCYGRERISQDKAAEMCGISTPTWVKWANRAILGEPIPDTFFKKGDK